MRTRHHAGTTTVIWPLAYALKLSVPFAPPSAAVIFNNTVLCAASTFTQDGSFVAAAAHPACGRMPPAVARSTTAAHAIVFTILGKLTAVLPASRPDLLRIEYRPAYRFGSPKMITASPY